MADISVKVDGLEEIIKRLDTAPTRVAKFSREVVETVALKAEAEAKKEAPVDRSDLIKSIETKVDTDFKATVKPMVPYADFVHDGTGRFKDGSDQGRVRWNRVRNNWLGKFSSRQEMVKTFAGMRKRGKRFSIRPDKFMDRATFKTEPKVNVIAQRLINRFINTFI